MIQRTILSLPGNNSCMDCHSPNPCWASLSYGTVLCLSCAGIHRGLGVHVSFVRSLKLDIWSPIQVNIMIHGGNSKCREFLTCHGGYTIDNVYNASDSNPGQVIRERYSSDAAKWFSESLKEVAKKQYEGSQEKMKQEQQCHTQDKMIEESFSISTTSTTKTNNTSVSNHNNNGRSNRSHNITPNIPQEYTSKTITIPSDLISSIPSQQDLNCQRSTSPLFGTPGVMTSFRSTLGSALFNCCCATVP